MDFRLEMSKGLVTNYREGGGYEMGRGACEVLTIRKGGGGGGKSFSHAEEGTHSFGVVFTQKLEVLAIL